MCAVRFVFDFLMRVMLIELPFTLLSTVAFLPQPAFLRLSYFSSTIMNFFEEGHNNGSERKKNHFFVGKKWLRSIRGAKIYLRCTRSLAKTSFAAMKTSSIGYGVKCPFQFTPQECFYIPIKFHRKNINGSLKWVKKKQFFSCKK